MKIKSTLQKAARSLGFRIVPRDRDCATCYDWIRAIQFKTIVDVGAHKGATVAKWLDDFPGAFIHAIEPLPAAFESLERVVSDSGNRAKAWNYAATDSGGTVKFFEHPDHPSSSSVLRATEESKSSLPFTRSERELTVPSATLDQLLIDQHGGVDTPMLIKLDVQGMESGVVRGAPQIFEAASVVLAEVSVMPLYKGQCTFMELYGLLAQHSFEFRGILEQFHLADGTPVYFDALFAKKGQE